LFSYTTKQDTGSDVSEATHEETEEEFLERYAQTARDLQDEACEEAEYGQHEDGHELALGMPLHYQFLLRFSSKLFEYYS